MFEIFLYIIRFKRLNKQNTFFVSSSTTIFYADSIFKLLKTDFFTIEINVGGKGDFMIYNIMLNKYVLNTAA